MSANKGSDPTRSYRCVFIDSNGNQSCRLDIVATGLDHIERWANDVIERAPDDVTGAEIWCDGELMALLGTTIAARSKRNGRSYQLLLAPVQRDTRFGTGDVI